jgi:hypothetical protein
MFYVEDVDILQEDKLTKAQLAQALKATHTINEIRRDLYEMEPLEGGDALPGAAQQNPFFGLSTIAPETKDNKEVDQQTIIIPEHNAADVCIKANADWFDRRKRKIDEATKEPVKNISSMLIDMFADQAVSVIGDLESIAKQKALVPASDDDIMKMIEKNVNKFEKEWKDIYKKELSTTTEDGYSIAFDTPMTIEGTEQAQTISDKIKADMRKILSKRAEDSFIKVSKTTSDSIFQIIKNGFDKSKNITQIAQDISSVFANPEKMMYRANRISRTESLSALSIGQDKAMKEAKQYVPDLKKMWISTEDQRTRGNPSGLYPDSDADHWGLHGQIVSADNDFVDPRNNAKMMFPRDPKGGASSVINCRCTWIMLPAKEMDKFRKQESEAQPHE